MRNTTLPGPEVRQLLADPDEAVIRSRDMERVADHIPADAEEEEIAELWAADPGNQGA